MLAREIHESLHVKELLHLAMIPGLDFLRDDELSKLTHDNVTPSGYLADRVLCCLKTRDTLTREEDFLKFIACIKSSSSHRGHLEITKYIKSKLDEEEWDHVERLIEEGTTTLPSPYMTPIPSPERPIAFISLQGELVEENFLKIECRLWLSFSKGCYNDLECLIEDCGQLGTDCQVVALWFKSLIMMHRHAKYPDAIETLDRAMALSFGSENENILTGRILQRKAQIYLMMGLKNDGARSFEHAKDQLQFVGRGYDKTNMYCREAKMLSATEPNRRADIEKVYNDALGTLEKDDPYFLASYPSVTLSKAAFHLHFAFGSKWAPTDKLPTVSSNDMQKARETLSDFNEEEHILIDMRRCEYDLIQAELCRLEGRQDEAQSRFANVIRSADRKKMGNIASIATHRFRMMSRH